MLIRQNGFTAASGGEAKSSFGIILLVGLAMMICFATGLILIGLPTIFGSVFDGYPPDMKFTVRVTLISIGLFFLGLAALTYRFLWRRPVC